MQTKLVLKQRSALKMRFQPGATGPAGQIVSVDATTLAPGEPATVVNNGTPEAAELLFGIPEGEQGIPGLTGNKGWSPAFAIISDGARRVLQVDDWVGGEGVKPATGDYVGATGLTPTIGDAVDIRGPAGTATIPDGDKGDITSADSGDTWTIDNDAVTNAKLANMATARIKGRTTAGAGDPEDLTGAQATALLDAFTGDSGSGGAKGLVPAPAAGDAAAGKVLSAGGGWVSPSSTGIFGQCYLSLNGSNLVLSPRNGNQLFIGGTNQTIPSAGVFLSPTGFTPGTFYYIYAYMNSGTMMLEASTTAYGIGSVAPYIGFAVKNGDASRTLVGLADCVAGPAWTDTSSRIGVISWFNRLSKTVVTSFTANRDVTGSLWTEVNTEIRNTFMCWPDEEVEALAVGGWTESGAGTGYSEIRFDGGSSGVSGASACSSNGTVSMTLKRSAALAAGRHYATIFAYQISGTNILFIGATDGRVTLSVTVRG